MKPKGKIAVRHHLHPEEIMNPDVVSDAVLISMLVAIVLAQYSLLLVHFAVDKRQYHKRLPEAARNRR